MGTYDTELPAYMVAADIHNAANGKPTFEDDSSTFDAVTKGSLSVIARGITSAFNTVPAVANWFGADIPEWKTEDLLSQFDDDLSTYYSQHRDTIDVVGDVAASFIPGMAAIKGLNYAQKGLAGLSRGSAGRNLLQSFGALPTAAETKLVPQTLAKIAQGDTFTLVDQSVIKAFGTKYAQNALEMGVFEVAAASTMGEYSPIFKDHTASDILYNAALGGGLVGGGIMGTVSAVQTYGAIKAARLAADKILLPFRRISETPEGVDEFVKVLNLKHQLDNPPITSDAVTTRALENRNRKIVLDMQESLTKINGGDADLSYAMYKSLQGMDKDQAWANMLYMQEAGRAGKPLKIEADLVNKEMLIQQRDRFKQGSDDWFKVNDKIEKLSETNVKYVSLADGSVTHTEPLALPMADRFAPAEIESKLQKTIVRQGEAWTPIGKSLDDIEARYIVAAKQDIQNGAHIGADDLPVLEAAWNKGLTEVAINGIQYDRMGLWHHLQTTKESMLAKLADVAELDPTASAQKIARSINVDTKLVEAGGVDPLHTKTWIAKDDFATNYTAPNYVKVGYKGNIGVDGNEMRGMVVIKQLQNLQEAENLKAITAVLGEDAVSKLIKLSDADVLSSTSAGAGAGLLSLASGEYLTTASKVEWLGKVTNALKVEGQKQVNDALQPVMHKILQNESAGAELVALRQQILQTGEKYVWANGEVVHADVARYERQIAKGSKRAVAPKLAEGVPERLPITQAETKGFMDEWVRFNNQWLQKEATLKNAIGKGIGNYEDVIHFPQPDSTKFKFFSFVVPKNPAEGEKIQMIWAASPEALANLESKVDSNYTILHKADTDRFYKVTQQYDHDLGMSSYQVRADLKRTGVAAPFFPVTDAQTLMQDMIAYRHKVSDRQVRDAVSLHNSVAFSEFNRLDAEHIAVQTSAKGAVNVDSPYASYVKTALDIPRSSHVPAWTQFNNLAENVYTKAVTKLGDAWKGLKSPEELAKVNASLEEAGVRGFKDSITELWANHPADKKLLSQHTMALNGFLSTTILRLDPMNAVNNGFGATVLGGSELSHVIALGKKMGPEVEARLNNLISVGVPGTTASIKSPAKLYAGGVTDFFKFLRKDPEMMQLHDFYNKNGWMPSFLDQLRETVDSSILIGTETKSELSAKLSKLLKDGGNFGEKWTGNKMAEEMNRFVAARAAHQISDAIGMEAKEQLAFINTFVNRTQGNYLASQRPMMFQGPVGHAISLFQTYQFNMMQHLFRHVANGEGKKAAMLLGLQTSLYGFNGLPAFSLLNQTLIGNAAGNLEHDDVYSYMQRAGDVGNWLLYGSLSNATGLGIYSRGDLNPRQVTVLPTNLSDIPFVSATRTAFASMLSAGKDIAQGANVGSTILRGIEHAGLSRPLAGLATTMQGLTSDDGQSYSTNQKNQLMSAWDMYSISSLQRISGARPFEEAVTRDAMFRVQAYESKDQAKINSIGSAIRDTVRSGDIPTAEQYENFVSNYVKAGGNQEQFIKYWQKQVKDAPRSRVNEMVEHSKSRYSNYLQTMMGGYEPGGLE